MRVFFLLLARELRAFFLSPTGWVVLALFMCVTGVSFSAGVNFLRLEPTWNSIVQFTFNPKWSWYFFFVCPLITMRLFAEERKTGTLESLLTAPVRAGQVLLAKYLAAVVFYLVLIAPVLLYFVVLNWVMKGKVEIPQGQVLGSYVIIVAAALFNLALGCLASALTRNQIIAAILGFALILLHFLAGTFLLYTTQDNPEQVRPLLDHVVTMRHMDNFTSGLIDTRPLVYYVSFTLFLLAVTLQILEYRRWKA